MKLYIAVYLAGPIHGQPPKGAWQAYATELLRQGLGERVEVINPIDLEVNLDEPQDVVNTDLEAISACDYLLALCETPSWGTAMEIRHACDIGVPVIGVKRHWWDVSPWLEHHVTYKVGSWEQAIDLLPTLPTTGDLFSGRDDEWR